MSEVVGFELRGRNAIITIDNPPVNALSLGVRQGLMERVDRAAMDSEVLAIILIGLGRTFPAGADIREFDKPVEEPHLLSIIDHFDSIKKPPTDGAGSWLPQDDRRADRKSRKKTRVIGLAMACENTSFDVESRNEEEHTPQLFSHDNESQSENDLDEFSRDAHTETLFDQDSNEEDFEIPAFLRKQKF